MKQAHSDPDMAGNDVALASSAEVFILRWGDLGSQWGVNRSVAQIQALLYLSEGPLTAESIAQALNLARSNVSNSLKELLAWKLIRRVPVKGDRRDFFVAETDLWQMLFCIASGRKEREIDPVVAALQDSIIHAQNDPELSSVSLQRLTNMQDFVTRLSGWHDQMMQLPSSTLMKLINMGSRVARLINPISKKK